MFSDELINQRAAKESMRQTSQQFVQLLQSDSLRDPYDGPVYEHARNLFESDMTKKKTTFI